MQPMDRRAALSRCPDARLLLPAYIEGELSGAEHDRVVSHLAICASCRREAETYRHALKQLHSVPRREPPRDLYAGFTARWAEHEAVRQRRSLQLRFASMAAAVLLVVGVAAAPLLHRPPAAPARVASVPTPGPLAVALRPTTQPAPKPRMLPAAPYVVEPQQSMQVAGTAPTREESWTPREPRREAVRRAPLHVDVASRGPVRPQADARSFWEVQPQQGLSARQQLAHLAAFGGPGATPVQEPAGEPVPIHKNVLIPDENERVQVGDTVTVVHTAHREDDSGHRTAIDVNIATAAAPQGAAEPH